jgi:hypothetical protein
MFKRVSSICLFFAWLCASGALLDTIQVYAWARMFIGYTQSMSIAEAAVKTMDPEKPCPICLAVRRAREAEPHQQSAFIPTSAVKMLLAHVQNEPFILSPNRPEWPESHPVLMASWRPPVPVPPPRTPIRSLVG